jgi:hypothetical protein
MGWIASSSRKACVSNNDKLIVNFCHLVCHLVLRWADALQPERLKQPEPHLTDRRIRWNGMPQAINGNSSNHSDCCRVNQFSPVEPPPMTITSHSRAAMGRPQCAVGASHTRPGVLFMDITPGPVLSEKSAAVKPFKCSHGLAIDFSFSPGSLTFS